MNTLEIIQEMRANPALAEELRAVLLSRGLLELPELVREIARLAERHDERLNAIDERLARHEERLNDIDERLARLVEITQRHDVQIARLVGSDLESRWRRDAAAYLGSRGLRRVRFVDTADLSDTLDELLVPGKLSDEERQDILVADAVHVAVRSGDGVAVYVVTEVSSRVHRHDVERAARRARLLEQALNVSCMPMVAGMSIDELADAAARESGVTVVLPSSWAVSAA